MYVRLPRHVAQNFSHFLCFCSSYLQVETKFEVYSIIPDRKGKRILRPATLLSSHQSQAVTLRTKRNPLYLVRAKHYSAHLH